MHQHAATSVRLMLAKYLPLQQSLRTANTPHNTQLFSLIQHSFITRELFRSFDISSRYPAAGFLLSPSRRETSSAFTCQLDAPDNHPNTPSHFSRPYMPATCHPSLGTPQCHTARVLKLLRKYIQRYCSKCAARTQGNLTGSCQLSDRAKASLWRYL